MFDLQSYLAEYEKKKPADIVHIKKSISAKYDITAIVEKFEKESRFPILIFHAVVDSEGKTSKYPLVTNIFSSRRRVAELVGAEPETAAHIFQRKTRQEKKLPIVVGKEEARVKEVIEKGDKVDLRKFPILTHHYGDPGPYLSAGLLITYNPDLMVDNAGGVHRGWVKDGKRIGTLVTPTQHNWMNFEKYWKEGKDAPVAYVNGAHPTMFLGLQARMGYPESHFEAAGGLAGEGVRLVPSETLGDDFLVPADAEVVIEGFIKPGDFGPEGPFGEYPRYLGPQRWSPFITVTAVTHRMNPVWLDIMPGHADHMGAGGLAIEAVVFDAVKRAIPTVKNVHFPLSGCRRFHAYVQLGGRINDGDARQAILAALTADFRLKHVFVFDDDVDIFDDREVMWAIATRTQWDKDIVVVPGMTAAVLDPSIEADISTKGGIDCTKPAPPEPFSTVVKIPEENRKKTRLDEFIDHEALLRIPVERM